MTSASDKEQVGMNASQPRPGEWVEEERGSLLDVLLVVARYRNLIIFLPLIMTVLAGIYVFTQPFRFTATAYVLPVQQSQQASMAALLGQFSLGGFGGGANNNSPLFVRILQSRRIAEDVIQHFKLKDVYGTSTPGQTLQALQDRLKIESDKSGIIAINVEDAHQQRAADIANYFVERLLVVTRDLTLSEASRRRVFFEQQLGVARGQLMAAEAQLKAFQGRTGIVNLEAQGQATLGVIARLQAEITAKEIQLKVLRTTATEANPLVSQAVDQIRAMRAELARMQSTADQESPDSLGKLSSGSLEYAKNYREVKYREAVLEILGKQYEAARLDEARDTPAIQVLDKAMAPEIPSSPKRKKTILITGVLSAIFAIILSFILDGFRKAKAQPENREKLDDLIGLIRKPVFSNKR